MEIPFIKLEANGNTYLLIQEECMNKNLNTGHLISKMASKNHGIGSDGALILSDTYRPIPYIEVYNSDGSKASLCINGIRIVSKYLFDTKYKDKNKLKIKTDAGVYESIHSLNNIIVKVKLHDTLKEENHYFNHKKYHVYLLDIGNKHAYLLNDKNIIPHYFKYTLGKHLSHYYQADVGLINIINSHTFSIISYENGSRLTQSSGSNICGAAMLLNQKGLVDENEDIDVETLGGFITLRIENNEVLYSGQTTLICKGTYYL